MKASDFDISAYLNAQIVKDMGIAGQNLRIAAIRAEAIRDIDKMVMSFAGVDKGLVVNKTNRTALVDAWGDETDNWIGHSVRLQVGRTLFQGSMVPSITVFPIIEEQKPIVPEEKPKGKKK